MTSNPQQPTDKSSLPTIYFIFISIVILSIIIGIVYWLSPTTHTDPSSTEVQSKNKDSIGTSNSQDSPDNNANNIDPIKENKKDTNYTNIKDKKGTTNLDKPSLCKDISSNNKDIKSDEMSKYVKISTNNSKDQESENIKDMQTSDEIVKSIDKKTQLTCGNVKISSANKNTQSSNNTLNVKENGGKIIQPSNNNLNVKLSSSNKDIESRNGDVKPNNKNTHIIREDIQARDNSKNIQSNNDPLNIKKNSGKTIQPSNNNLNVQESGSNKDIESRNGDVKPNNKNTQLIDENVKPSNNNTNPSNNSLNVNINVSKYIKTKNSNLDVTQNDRNKNNNPVKNNLNIEPICGSNIIHPINENIKLNNKDTQLILEDVQSDNEDIDSDILDVTTNSKEGQDNKDIKPSSNNEENLKNVDINISEEPITYNQNEITLVPNELADDNEREKNTKGFIGSIKEQFSNLFHKKINNKNENIVCDIETLDGESINPAKYLYDEGYDLERVDNSNSIKDDISIDQETDVNINIDKVHDNGYTDLNIDNEKSSFDDSINEEGLDSIDIGI